jgi:hypothetical protein
LRNSQSDDAEAAAAAAAAAEKELQTGDVWMDDVETLPLCEWRVGVGGIDSYQVDQ